MFLENLKQNPGMCASFENRISLGGPLERGSHFYCSSFGGIFWYGGQTDRLKKLKHDSGFSVIRGSAPWGCRTTPFGPFPTRLLPHHHPPHRLLLLCLLLLNRRSRNFPKNESVSLQTALSAACEVKRICSSSLDMSMPPRSRRQSVSVVGGSSGASQQSTIRDAAALSSAISTLKNDNILLKCTPILSSLLPPPSCLPLPDPPPSAGTGAMERLNCARSLFRRTARTCSGGARQESLLFRCAS
jgi:hypothetical protein